MNNLEMTCALSLDPMGEELPSELILMGDEVTLFPANGNSASLTVTLKFSDGKPAPGRRVSCRSEPVALTGAEWRNINNLAPRFKKSESLIRERVAQGIVRLTAKVSPAVAVTDQNGVATFRIDAFHVCGNDEVPAADHIITSSEAGESRALVKCAVNGLVRLSDNPGGGLTTHGLVGRHMHPQVIQVLSAIGDAWKRVGSKPSGMPNHITLTGATMRWGGLNPPHTTHRFGGTADLRPIGTRDGEVKISDPHYSREGTKILIDFLRQSGASAIYFADNLPGVTEVKADHANHIHVSWLKDPREPWLVALSTKELIVPAEL